MKIEIRGRLAITKWRQRGRLWVPEWTREEDNLVVLAALVPVSKLLGGDVSNQSIAAVGFGSGSATPLNTDTALTTPAYFRAVGSHSYPQPGQVQFAWALQYPVSSKGTWSATTAYSIGDTIYPLTPNGHWFKCTTAGTSGGSEPVWNTGAGATTADGGTLVWTENGQADSGADGINIQEMGLFCNTGAISLPTTGTPAGLTLFAHKLNGLGVFGSGLSFTGTWTEIAASGG
jgi:hypothetical protein